MSGQTFLESLTKRFGAAITGGNFEAIDPWIEVSPDGLIEVCTFLRDEPELRFNLLNCISGVDYFEPDPKKAAKVRFGIRTWSWSITCGAFRTNPAWW